MPVRDFISINRHTLPELRSYLEPDIMFFIKNVEFYTFGEYYDNKMRQVS